MHEHVIVVECDLYEIFRDELIRKVEGINGRDEWQQIRVLNGQGISAILCLMETNGEPWLQSQTTF